MFAALLINSNVVQVGEASSLRANPHNVRVLYGEYSHQRGPIVVGGKDVARSVKTHDSLKYLRTYPGRSGVRARHRLLLTRLSGVRASSRPRTRSCPAPTTGCSSSGSPTRSPAGPRRADRSTSPSTRRRSERRTTAWQQRRRSAASAPERSSRWTRRPARSSRWPPIPSYDPSVLTSHNSRAGRRRLEADACNTPGSPLLDRAVNEAYPPGSTFKVDHRVPPRCSSGKYTPTATLPAPNQLQLPEHHHTLSNFAGETCAGGGIDHAVRRVEGLLQHRVRRSRPQARRPRDRRPGQGVRLRQQPVGPAAGRRRAVT